VGRLLLHSGCGAEFAERLEAEIARGFGWNLLRAFYQVRAGSPSPVVTAVGRVVPQSVALRLAGALRRVHKKGFEWLERALIRRRLFRDVLAERRAGTPALSDGELDLVHGIPASTTSTGTDVVVRFAGLELGRIAVPHGARVRRSDIRRTIRREMADELVAAAVRSALLEKPYDGSGSLVERAKEQRARPTLGNAAGGAGAPEGSEAVPLHRAAGRGASVELALQRVSPRLRRALGARAIAERLPILAYHRVVGGLQGLATRFCVDPDTFESHLAFLRERGFYSISIEDWDRTLRRRIVLRGRPILITFDDGYADIADTAWPLLQRYGFSATVFLVTDLVGGTSRWDRHLGSDAPLLDWGQIRSLERAGVRFGSHSARHVPLGTLSGDEIVEEVSASRAALRARLEQPVAGFAYPYGDVDDVVRCLVERGGFRFGFTTRAEPATEYHHRLDLPRIEVLAWDRPADLERKMWLQP
jgi:peptidoglycan/xylan/chitin deacetylase (PgdA/CDA1 family)